MSAKRKPRFRVISYDYREVRESRTAVGVWGLTRSLFTVVREGGRVAVIRRLSR